MYISKDKRKATMELKSFMNSKLKEFNEVKNKAWEILEYQYKDDSDKVGVEEKALISNRVTGTQYRVYCYHNTSDSHIEKVS